MEVNEHKNLKNFFHAVVVFINRTLVAKTTSDQPSALNPSSMPALNAYPSRQLFKTPTPDSSCKIGIDFGAAIEIIDGPAEHDGIETVHVKDLKSGKDGHVFLSELQASCSPHRLGQKSPS